MIGQLMTLSHVILRSWKITPDVSDEDLRDHLLRIRQLGMRNFIVWVEPDTINRLLKEVRV